MLLNKLAPLFLRTTFHSDSIKCNMAQNWHTNLPIILIYPDVNMRSAFHKSQDLALTNAISRLQNQWSVSGKYTKATKCTRGKANMITHECTCYLLQYVPMPTETHTDTHSVRGVRQHQQPCPMTHTRACPASIPQFSMLALSSRLFLLFPFSISVFHSFSSCHDSTKISVALESRSEWSICLADRTAFIDITRWKQMHAHISADRNAHSDANIHAGLSSARWVEP